MLSLLKNILHQSDGAGVKVPESVMYGITESLYGGLDPESWE